MSYGLTIHDDQDVIAILRGSRTCFAVPIMPNPYQSDGKSSVPLGSGVGASHRLQPLPGDWVFPFRVGAVVAADPRSSTTLLDRAPYRAQQLLWVKEAWAPHPRQGYRYRADLDEEPAVWRDAALMPRDAVRLTLQVADVTVGKRGDSVVGLPAWKPAEGKSDPWVWLVRFEAQDAQGRTIPPIRE